MKTKDKYIPISNRELLESFGWNIRTDKDLVGDMFAQIFGFDMSFEIVTMPMERYN